MLITAQQESSRALCARSCTREAFAIYGQSPVQICACKNHLEMCMTSDPIPSLLETAFSAIQPLHHGALLCHHRKARQGLSFKAAYAVSADILSPRCTEITHSCRSVPGYDTGPSQGAKLGCALPTELSAAPAPEGQFQHTA